jgi:chromosome segregation ATPase
METMYNERLEEVARKGELMETKALQKLKEHVEEKLKSTYRELAVQIEAEKNDLKSKMDELEKIVYQIEQDTTDKLAQLRENNESSLASLQEELGSEITQKTESLRTDLERQTAETEKAFYSVRENLEKQWAQVEEKTLQRRQNLDTFLQEMQKRVDTLSAELAERMKETESKFHEELASFQAQADQLSQELHILYEGIGKNLENTKAGLNNEVRTFDSFIKKTFQEQEEKVLRLGEELQGKVLHNLESRLQEQEKDFSYRFARIEEVSSEIDNLENNLRNFMERTRVRLQEDFNNFGKQLHDQRLADQEEVSKGIAELRNTMAELENGLAELKTQAYENVSEKLKVFEDEFFKDLRNRDQLMQSKFIEWQNKVDSTLDTLAAEQVEERKKIEERYKEELSEVLRDFQGRFFLQLENLNTEMEAFRKQSDYRMQELDKVLQNYREELIRGIEESKMFR